MLSSFSKNTSAAGRLSIHGKVRSHLLAPLKVNALFTTKKAKEERDAKRLQASSGDEPNPPSTSSPLLSIDKFEKEGFRLGAFSKANEQFIGRLAMLGIASSVLGELLTGKGALGQLGLETGLPVFELDWTILVVVVFNIIGALAPTKEEDDFPSSGRNRSSSSGSSTTTENMNDGESSVTTSVSESTNGISLADFARFFSVKNLFSKDREILVGRVAQIGFAASLLGEGLTGKGILAQFNVETGITVADLKIFLVVFVVLTLIASVWEDKEDGGGAQG